MANRQTMAGNWNEIKGKVKEKWGALTDDDLVRGEGNVEQLVGIIQQKTGRAKEEIERFVNKVVDESSDMYQRAASTAREYAGEAGEALRHGYEQASDAAMQQFRAAEDSIRRNPAESIALSFGAGLISGVLVGLLLRSR